MNFFGQKPHRTGIITFMFNHFAQSSDAHVKSMREAKKQIFFMGLINFGSLYRR